MQGGVRICDHRVVLSPSIPSFCDICPRMHGTRSSPRCPREGGAKVEAKAAAVASGGRRLACSSLPARAGKSNKQA